MISHDRLLAELTRSLQKTLLLVAFLSGCVAVLAVAALGFTVLRP